MNLQLPLTYTHIAQKTQEYLTYSTQLFNWELNLNDNLQSIKTAFLQFKEANHSLFNDVLQLIQVLSAQNLKYQGTITQLQLQVRQIQNFNGIGEISEILVQDDEDCLGLQEKTLLLDEDNFTAYFGSQKKRKANNDNYGTKSENFSEKTESNTKNDAENIGIDGNMKPHIDKQELDCINSASELEQSPTESSLSDEFDPPSERNMPENSRIANSSLEMEVINSKTNSSDRQTIPFNVPNMVDISFHRQLHTGSQTKIEVKTETEKGKLHTFLPYEQQQIPLQSSSQKENTGRKSLRDDVSCNLVSLGNSAVNQFEYVQNHINQYKQFQERNCSPSENLKTANNIGNIDVVGFSENNSDDDGLRSFSIQELHSGSNSNQEKLRSEGNRGVFVHHGEGSHVSSSQLSVNSVQNIQNKKFTEFNESKKVISHRAKETKKCFEQVHLGFEINQSKKCNPSLKNSEKQSKTSPNSITHQPKLSNSSAYTQMKSKESQYSSPQIKDSLIKPQKRVIKPMLLVQNKEKFKLKYISGYLEKSKKFKSEKNQNGIDRVFIELNKQAVKNIRKKCKGGQKRVSCGGSRKNGVRITGEMFSK